MSIFFDSSSFDSSFRSFFRSFSLSLPLSRDKHRQSVASNRSLPSQFSDRPILPTYLPTKFFIYIKITAATRGTRTCSIIAAHLARTPISPINYYSPRFLASSSSTRREIKDYISYKTRVSLNMLNIFSRLRYTRFVTRVCFRLLRNESYAKDWKNSSFSNLRVIRFLSFSLSLSISILR